MDTSLIISQHFSNFPGIPKHLHGDLVTLIIKNFCEEEIQFLLSSENTERVNASLNEYAKERLLIKEQEQLVRELGVKTYSVVLEDNNLKKLLENCLNHNLEDFILDLINNQYSGFSGFRETYKQLPLIKLLGPFLNSSENVSNKFIETLKIHIKSATTTDPHYYLQVVGATTKRKTTKTWLDRGDLPSYTKKRVRYVFKQELIKFINKKVPLTKNIINRIKEIEGDTGNKLGIQNPKEVLKELKGLLGHDLL